MEKKIMVTQPLLPSINEYFEELRDIWETKWLTNMGEKHNHLEKILKEYLELKNLVLFSNGHLSLESIIEAFELKGEIITTPFSFVSTANAIVRKGIKAVFVDVEEDYFTIDVNKIEEKITNKTTALIPVHVYGNICNIEEIENLANKYNLKVIYDAAHAFGVSYSGRGIGNFGDAAIFSFHATKVFNTIEGGAVAFNDRKIKDTLNMIKNFGITGLENVDYIGGNSKMNEFQAAMGICNMKNIKKEIENRKKVFDRYIKNLLGYEGIVLPKEQKDVKSNYGYLPVLFRNYKLHRDEVCDLLKKNNIFARKYFYPLINETNCYKRISKKNETPIAKSISEQVLTLPIYGNLLPEDIDRICDIIITGK